MFESVFYNGVAIVVVCTVIMCFVFISIKNQNSEG